MLFHGAAVLLVLQACAWSAGALSLNSNSENTRQRRPTGEWGEWSAWISCSAECGSGITARTRRCQHPVLLPVDSLLSTGDASVWCDGEEKEIKLCNKQACTDGRLSFREAECAKYKSSVYSLQNYTWEPFIHPTDPCRSTCRAKGYHFYANLAERVVDGTPCGGAGAESAAVCVQGVCKEIGCDDVVGSPWRRDGCGLCKGDNSTCRTISGIFTGLDLERGPNKIVTIPLGSTLVNISELRPSINSLALQSPDGEFLLNGGDSESPPGNYPAAGTVFTYVSGRVDCPGDCLFAPGPTDKPLNLMIVARGRNRGVMYSFNVPVDVTDEYFRQIITGGYTYSSEQNVASTTSNDIYRTAGENKNINNGDSRQLPATQDVDLHPPTSDDEKNGVNGEDGDDIIATDNGKVSVSDNLKARDSESDEETDGSLYVYDDNDEFDDNADEKEDDSDSVSMPAHSAADPNELRASSVSPMQGQETENTVSGPLKDGSGGTLKIIRKERPAFVNADERVEGLAAFGDDVESHTTQSDIDIGGATPSYQGKHQDKGSEESLTPSAESSSLQSHHWTSTPAQQASHHQGDDLENGSDLEDTDDLEDEDNFDNTDELEDEDESEDTDDLEESQDHQSKEKPTTSQSPQEVTEDSKNQKDAADGTQTAEPDHLHRPQSDSPTYGPFHQRVQSGDGNRNYSFHQFRHPKYSQSFTFRHRYQQLVDAANKGLIGDDSGSGYHHRRPPSYPAPPSGHGSPQQGSEYLQQQYNRQIRYRQQPQRQDSQNGQNPRAGYEADDRYEQSRRDQAHRQALTLGQTVSREEDSRQSQTVVVQPTARSREEYEYSRRQEEYRRELLRRRQLYEQQRAAQDAEYQRRLEEHNHRLRERQMQIERQQQQQQQQQQQYAARQQELHRRRHQNHDQYTNAWDRQTHQQRHHQRQPVTAPVAPAGGILSRINTSVTRQQPLYTAGRNDTRDRITEKQEADELFGESSTAPSEGPGIVDIRQHQRVHQQHGVDVDISQDDTTTTMQATEPTESSSTTGSSSSSPTQQKRGHQHLTPAPTRDYLAIPQQPQEPVVSNTGPINRGPVAPQFIPVDSRFEGRPTLTSALSNRLEDDFDTDQQSGLNVNLIPNVIESRPVVGEGSLTSNEIEVSMSYEWRVSGLTECTLTCGGGVQQTVVVCLDTRTQAYVTDENCASVERPRPKAVTCNTRPCPAEWQTSPWTDCSATCGPGEQSRSVKCAARVSATLNVTMSDENCRGAPKPETRRVCQSRACNSWIIGDWSQCSVQCGEGVRTRTIRCADQNGNDVSHIYCTEPKPDQEQACEMGPCGKGWYYTEWPEQCQAHCGAGTKSRNVACLGESGDKLPDSRCDKFSRPTLEQPCRSDIPCGGDWFASEWEQCNVTCGGGVREREVVCMKSLGGGLLTVVNDENCAAELKPVTEEPCDISPCEAEWYMTSWSECSQSCGTGQRTREVKCLDPQQQPSSDCPLGDKPRTREPCNTERCTTPNPRPDPPPGVSDSECTDSFSRCEIVKHARMCRYPYYRAKCCVTCSGET